MTTPHRARVEATLAEAATNHAALLERLSPEMRATLPVDAQGLTEAIDFVAEAAGLSSAERRALVRPHAVNPAVMHARVFGGAPLTGTRTPRRSARSWPSPRGSTVECIRFDPTPVRLKRQ